MTKPSVAPRTFRCGACDARYDDVAWRALSISECIGPEGVRRLVTDWPETSYIEIRCCKRCGHTIAAKRTRAAAF